MAISGIVSPYASSKIRSKTLTRVLRRFWEHIRRKPGIEELSGGLARVRRSAGELRIFGGEGRQNSGQFHAENCATFLTVVTKNSSGVFLDDAEADAETQA